MVVSGAVGGPVVPATPDSSTTAAADTTIPFEPPSNETL